MKLDIIVDGAAGRIWAETEHGEAELNYKIKDGYMTIYHTGTPVEDRGHGIAESIADRAFAYAKEKHLRIVPACPYIQHYIKKNRITQY